MIASKRLSLSWSGFHYPSLPLMSQVVEKNGGAILGSPRVGGQGSSSGATRKYPRLIHSESQSALGKVILFCELVVFPSL